MASVHGVNFANLEQEALKILDIADEAIARLYDIESLVDDSSAYFKGDFLAACRDKTSDIATSFLTVKNNIISYAEELRRLMAKYQTENEIITTDIINVSNNIGEFDFRGGES